MDWDTMGWVRLEYLEYRESEGRKVYGEDGDKGDDESGSEDEDELEGRWQDDGFRI